MNSNFLDPKDILKQLNIPPGTVVADFGCGSGFFSLAFAEAVGEEGKINSLDILPSALESVESKAKLQGINNVFPQRVNLEKEGGSKLPEKSMDWVIVKDMLFQNKNKSVILKEAYRILKSEGRMLLVEWNDKEMAIGPEKSLRISKEELRRLSGSQGFEWEKDLDAGDFHYGVVFRK